MLAWQTSPCQPLVESVHSGQLSFLTVTQVFPSLSGVKVVLSTAGFLEVADSMHFYVHHWHRRYLHMHLDTHICVWTYMKRGWTYFVGSGGFLLYLSILKGSSDPQHLKATFYFCFKALSGRQLPVYSTNTGLTPVVGLCLTNSTDSLESTDQWEVTALSQEWQESVSTVRAFHQIQCQMYTKCTNQYTGLQFAGSRPHSKL